jgi:hypothetical protein
MILVTTILIGVALLTIQLWVHALIEFARDLDALLGTPDKVFPPPRDIQLPELSNPSGGYRAGLQPAITPPKPKIADLQ